MQGGKIRLLVNPEFFMERLTKQPERVAVVKHETGYRDVYFGEFTAHAVDQGLSVFVVGQPQGAVAKISAAVVAARRRPMRTCLMWATGR